MSFFHVPICDMVIKSFSLLFTFYSRSLPNFVIFLFVKNMSFDHGSNQHYCLVSLMWMKIGSNDITAQVPGVS
jgi:hypothetical protein